MVKETRYYEVLEVSPGDSLDLIKRSYRRLAKLHHPDKRPGAGERFKEISMVFGVLSDPDKRRLYDERGERGIKGGVEEEGEEDNRDEDEEDEGFDFRFYHSNVREESFEEFVDGFKFYKDFSDSSSSTVHDISSDDSEEDTEEDSEEEFGSDEEELIIGEDLESEDLKEVNDSDEEEDFANSSRSQFRHLQDEDELLDSDSDEELDEEEEEDALLYREYCEELEDEEEEDEEEEEVLAYESEDGRKYFQSRRQKPNKRKFVFNDDGDEYDDDDDDEEEEVLRGWVGHERGKRPRSEFWDDHYQSHRTQTQTHYKTGYSQRAAYYSQFKEKSINTRRNPSVSPAQDGEFFQNSRPEIGRRNVIKSQTRFSKTTQYQDREPAHSDRSHGKNYFGRRGQVNEGIAGRDKEYFEALSRLRFSSVTVTII